MGKSKSGDIHFHAPVIITGGQVGTGAQVQGAAGPVKASSDEGPTTAPGFRPIRILHLSDLHFRPDTAWSANPLLAALAAKVAFLREQGLAPDLVAITGDVAFSGQPVEYDQAERWLCDQLLPAAGLTAAELLLVPGNHDVDRAATKPFLVGASQDALLASRSEQTVAEVLQDPSQRALLTKRLDAWWLFAKRLRPAAGDLPWWSLRRSIRGVEVFAAGLNSAMLCRGNEDHGRLLLGLHQVHAATEQARGADLSLALMHHPFSFLAEWDSREVLPAIRAPCGVLLRGHLHEADPSLTVGPHTELLELAAGAVHDTERIPLSWQFVELDPFAGQARVHLFTWQRQRQAWVPDRNRAEPDGVAVLPLRKTSRPPHTPTDGSSPIEVRAGDQLIGFRELVRLRADTLADVFRAPGAPETLSQVWVELSLAGDTGATGISRERQVQRIEDVLEHPHLRWVLLGDPGCGKTTLLHHLALELLRKDKLLPVLLSIAELRAGEGIGQAVARCYGQEYARPVLAAIGRGRAVLLLDGLDEALRPASARRAVQAMTVAARRCAVIVASRTTGYQRPDPSFAELRVLALRETEQRQLLLRWVPDEAAVDRSLARMRSQPRLRRVAENPLLLTLAGLVLRGGREVPGGRSELYGWAMNVITRGKHRPAYARRLQEPTKALRLLGRLALAMHGEQREVYPTAALHDVLEARTREQAWIRDTWAGADLFLAEVAETTGLLVPDTRGRGAAGYLFPHRSFREYLAATALEADIGVHGLGDVSTEVLAAVARGEAPTEESPPVQGELQRVLEDGAQRPAIWSEVLALTCGLLGSGGADALVRRVAGQGSRELLLRVVAEAEGIMPDTVDAALALEKGGDAWEGRKKVLDDLGSLVSDPGTVNALLVRFLDNTTHGADIFWARENLRAIAGGKLNDQPVSTELVKLAAEEANRALCAPRAEALRRPEELKRLLAAWRWPDLAGKRQAGSTRRPEDDIWRPIPAGSFRMGSTKETDPDREENEGPQHAVRMTHGFRMLALPVTNAMYECFDPGHYVDREFEGEGLDVSIHPVVNVCWYEATMFAEWASRVLGEMVRLPTETEWEYACRGTTTLDAPSTRYWSGQGDEDLLAVGWVASNSSSRTHAVDQVPIPRGLTHPHGLLHLHGNVWEWCADYFGDYPSQLEERLYRPPLSTEVVNQDMHTIRAGSSFFPPTAARSAFRFAHFGALRSKGTGFRLVLLPESTPDDN